MIDYIKHQWKLNALFKEQDRIRNSYAEAVKKAQQDKDNEKAEMLRAEAASEDAIVDDEIRLRMTRYMIRMGIHESQVSRDERNEYFGINLERAAKILDALNARLRTRVEVEPLRQTAVA